ncbi:CBS domain-containing protein [Roseospira marina]|uniref:CBS domain-containing protein n=1 Tax=Roseospira marina TaxID=140057 RepID=A0A5M6ID35_9PROT|nr:CBS domain-containing protein [Roseospira marina]KAA5605982.1 CBS domain-containing protein [Roseospira marina]MBB4313169.1 CBS domain-containing protein [Roseospira marina]MBB5086090.1 CBS domain-containing protein [Roseospira marina]
MSTHDAQTHPTTLLSYKLGDCAPAELLNRSELSERDKLAVLRQWEYDAVELMVAEEENMGGGNPPPLSEIRDAIRALRDQYAPSSGGEGSGPSGATAGEVMSTSVRTVHSDNRIGEVATQMREDNVGLLVVLDGDAAVGVVTDRDIAIRAVAAGLNPGAHAIADIMTNRVVACAHSTPLTEAADLMAREGLRRLCVVDDGGGLVGILSLTDLALGADGDATIGRVLRAITHAPASGPSAWEETTNRHTDTGQPGGLHVYSLRPTVRS